MCEKLKFLINIEKDSLLRNTKKIELKSTDSNTNAYYLGDLFSTFSKMGHRCHFLEFVNVLNEVFTVYPDDNPKYAIVSDGHIEKSILKELQGCDVGNSKKESFSKHVDIEEEIESKNDLMYNISSCLTQALPSRFDNLPKYYVSDFRSRIEPSSSEEDSGIFKTPLNRKTPYNLSDLNVSHDTVEAFQNIKQLIVDAFNTAPILPIHSFNNAICQKHGIAFDYKRQSCDRPEHKHESLSKFLLCCSDIVKIISQKYIVHFDQSVIQKRHNQFLTGPRNCKNKIMLMRYRYYLEILIVNMFAIKVTIPFEDLEQLFQIVYKEDLSYLVSSEILENEKVRNVSSIPLDSSVLKKFLLRLKSPNILLCNNNGNLTVTVCPIWDEQYKVWFDNELHDEVYQIEKQIQQKDTEIKEVKINVSISKVLSKKIDPTSKNNLVEYIKIADQNIPKMVQSIKIDDLEDIEFDDLWKYLRHNINFDGKATFFE